MTVLFGQHNGKTSAVDALSPIGISEKKKKLLQEIKDIEDVALEMEMEEDAVEGKELRRQLSPLKNKLQEISPSSIRHEGDLLRFERILKQIEDKLNDIF